jgi:ABC-type lipoprotein export system ATPase subunit/GNAT superfamily N-acetyltransferase
MLGFPATPCPGPTSDSASKVSLTVELVQPVGSPSERTGRIALDFGLPLQSRRISIGQNESIVIGPGRIVLLLGPSGSGKSSILNHIARQFATARIIRDGHDPTLPHPAAPPITPEKPPAAPDQQHTAYGKQTAVIDAVAPWASIGNTINLLTACGLGDANLWIRPINALSDGERYRALLARAAALNERDGGVAPLLCDEFCSVLHRLSAKAISFNLRKLASRRKLSIVVASSHDDIVADLDPDTIVQFHGSGRCTVKEHYEPRTSQLRHSPAASKGRTYKRRAISFRRNLRIERGRKRDYEAFAAMHYRAADELGFVDKVFVLRERRTDNILGIVVYAHGALELSMRNQATGGQFVRNAEAVNAHFRMLRRLVIHPDIRGCGLGHHLVRRTLPLVGTEYVECLAAMGEHNPVFEKAGMKRIGQYELLPRQEAALKALRNLDVDPRAANFVAEVCRRRRVRSIVTRAVHDWYATTTAGGARRVERQSPEFLAQTFRGLIASRPVYYIWKRKKRNMKLTGAARYKNDSTKTNPYVPPSQSARRRKRQGAASHPLPARKRHDPY